MRKHYFEFIRYFAVSLVLFFIDMSLLLYLAKHIHYIVAATIGFLVGVILHYLLSIRFVFSDRRFRHKRHKEIVIFMAAGIFGLIINTVVIYVSVEWLELLLPLAKFLAAGFSFIAGYAIRKFVLFNSPAPKTPKWT